MSIYDEFRDLAQTLLEDEFGVPATILRVNNEYDPATDTRTKNEVVASCFAVLAPRKVVHTNGVISTETIAKTNSEIRIGDKVCIGSKEYQVQSVEEITPDGVPIMWFAVVK